jgi:parvulin-like peptidyl-prolyl isomerase
MVQVNGRYISVDDVYRGAYERAEGISTLTSKRDYTLAIKKIVQDELNVRIHDCLIIGEAEKKLADEEKTQIDKEMEDTLADMIADAGTKAKLQDRYTQRGLTLEDVLKDQRQRITIRAYLRSHFSSELVVGRKTLYEYFTSHKGEFSTPLKVQMQIISSPADAFLPKDLDGREASPAELKVAKEDARRNIELAAKALGEGKDFDQVAKTHSKDAHAKDGGVWPTMPKGSLKESKLEEAAFTQKEGQVSGIIPTDTGYYLVKTRKIQGASEQTFEAVQDKIEARLKDENYRKVTEQYLTKVYEGATISRTDDLIEAVCLRLMNTFSKP